MTGNFTSIKKQKYINWLSSQSDIPIFFQDWWLDAVKGKNKWDVILIESKNNIIAAMPYFIENQKLFLFVKLSKLTPYLGPWLVYPPGQKSSSKLSYEKDIFTEIISKLPDFDKLSMSLSPIITNWLPFYWNGFKQTTKYTYIIKNDYPDVIFNNFQSNIRTDIRKAEKITTINETIDLERFYKLNSMTFARQSNSKNPVSLNLLKNLDTVLERNNCRKILFAKDSKGEIHSAAYFIWDKKYVYYLLGGSDPKLRNSGAASLIMWEAIKFAMETGRDFNFEGSMIQPIERFFRAFGAIQLPYFKITKLNSIILKFIHALRS